MPDQSTFHRGTRFIIVVAAFVIIMWGIHQAQSVVVVLLVSVFLAVIGTVPALWMERHHVPSVAAVLIVVAAMVALLLGMGVVIGASVNSFSGTLPFYENRIHDTLFELKAQLATKGIVVTDDVLVGYANPAGVMDLTVGMFASLSSVLSNIVLILFTVIFILLEASGFPAKLHRVHDTSRTSLLLFTKFVKDIQHYVIIKTVINLASGTLIALWLSIIGVDFPLLWGFLAFLLLFIPSVGSLVAAVPAVLVALIHLGAGSAALVAAGYLAIGTLLGNVVEPKIMGARFDISPLVVLLSLVFWGNLLGVIGALLCVPLTLTLKLACETSEHTRWVAVLLGPEATPDALPFVKKKEK